MTPSIWRLIFDGLAACYTTALLPMLKSRRRNSSCSSRTTRRSTSCRTRRVSLLAAKLQSVTVPSEAMPVPHTALALLHIAAQLTTVNFQSHEWRAGWAQSFSPCIEDVGVDLIALVKDGPHTFACICLLILWDLIPEGMRMPFRLVFEVFQSQGSARTIRCRPLFFGELRRCRAKASTSAAPR